MVISFNYATFATELHPNVQAQAEELKGIVHKLFPSPKPLSMSHFWGAEELLLAAQSQPEHKLNLPLAENPINIGTHCDYIALVISLSTIALLPMKMVRCESIFLTLM